MALTVQKREMDHTAGQLLALLRVWWMWLQHYLKVGHAKRHHMGHLLERRGEESPIAEQHATQEMLALRPL